MESGRLIFDPTPSRHHRGGHMLFLGGSDRNSIFQGGRSVFGMGEGSNKRRLPFFASPEELYEEEYYDEQLQEKKRRLTPEQVHMLEQSFEAENKLEPDRKCELAKKLGLQPRQVAVWFQNRRARWKTKQLERDYDVLKASYDALLADRDALLKGNERLRSQVVSLTEKLKEKEVVEEDENTGLNKDNLTVAASVGDNVILQVQQKDRLSTGSAVVDSSGESYFRESYHGERGIRIHSEEEDGSDEGCSYLPVDVFADNHSNNDCLWAWN